MNAVINGSLNTEQEPMEIPAVLERWYAAQSPVRRLWAIEDAVEITVFVSLEPTSDGDDLLPVWLANKALWANDLKILIERDVRLKLVVSDFEEPYANTDAVMLAELCWRDSWASA